MYTGIRNFGVIAKFEMDIAPLIYRHPDLNILDTIKFRSSYMVAYDIMN